MMQLEMLVHMIIPPMMKGYDSSIRICVSYRKFYKYIVSIPR